MSGKYGDDDMVDAFAYTFGAPLRFKPCPRNIFMSDAFHVCSKCHGAMPASTCALCRECWSDKFQPWRKKQMDQYAHLRDRYPNAGAPWDSAEDDRLVSSLKRGLTVEILTRKHGRTPGAIVARIEKLMDARSSIFDRPQWVKDLAKFDWSQDARVMQQNLETERGSRLYYQRENTRLNDSLTAVIAERDNLAVQLNAQAETIYGLQNRLQTVTNGPPPPTWSLVNDLRATIDVLRKSIKAVRNAVSDDFS